LDPLEVAREAAKAAQDRKGRDVMVLDVRPVTLMADYFVISSGGTPVQVKAIADRVTERLKEQGLVFLHREGYDRGRWILLDYGDTVVHVFHDHERAFYNLERLWGDAPLVEMEPEPVE
jgi:ribosome-associated protein